MSIETVGVGQKSSNSLNIKISECEFINNKAEDGGGPIYTSKPHNNLEIYSIIFKVDNEGFVIPEAVFIFALSDGLIANSTFFYQTGVTSETLFQLNMDLKMSKISFVDINIVCLPWHKLDTYSHFKNSPKTGDTILKKLEAKCSPCAAEYLLAN